MARINIKEKKKEALKWWRQQVGVSRGPFTARSILRRRRDRFVPRPGYFVLLEYKAKHADKLPYWDKFPVGVILEVYEDGWLLLNLHYLPIQYRIKAFNVIAKRVKAKNPTKASRANITYAVFKSMASLNIAKACLKKHLFSQMKGGPVRIRWGDAARYLTYLDIEQWMVKDGKANIANRVYRDSMRIGRRR